MKNSNESSQDLQNAPSGADAGNGEENNAPGKNLLTYLMLIFVVPIMLARESAKALHKRVYEQPWSGTARQVFGFLLALGTGIASGYGLGWQLDWGWLSWLPSSAITAAVTYFYAWPLAYLGVVRPLKRLSEELWDAVTVRDQWFTSFLKGVSRTAVIAASAYIAWTQGGAALANLASNGWWAPFAWLGAIAWFCVLFAILANVTYWVFTTSIAGICAGTGFLTVYLLTPVTKAALTAYGLTNPGLVVVAQVVEFLLFIGYVFPLIHVVASHGLRFVRDIASRLYKSAYEKTVGVYEDVFTQVVNIYTAYHMAALSLLACAAIGFALSSWLAWAVPVVVALLSYLLVGSLFREVKNYGLGVVAAVHAGWASVVCINVAGYGVTYVIAGAALCAALTFFLVYPLVYVVVRLVGQYVLNNSIAGNLVTAHDKACDAAEQLLTEVARARKTTYGDESWFGSLFLHLANIAALVPVWHYSYLFLSGVGAAPWLATSLTGLALLASYLLLARFMDDYGPDRNVLAGVILTIGGALAIGVLTYAAQPFGLWLAIPASILGGFLVAGWIFPIAYVFARFLVNLIDGFVPFFSRVAEPVMRNVHAFGWRIVSGFWEQIVTAYRMARDMFAPLWASVSKAWQDAWKSVQDTWEQIKRGGR